MADFSAERPCRVLSLDGGGAKGFYARKLSAAQNLQEVVSLQAEYLRAQIEHASQFMREFTPKA
ncbi:phasin family protein [Bradyrhizobium centrosematis]|uniref:phasin family protein n=1 Tax=Bradyrhizobium centrosematis TaxID=1300039 RepID=UPI00216812DA|nr:phasin family protein [Bradyrhizobium centrosematis]MCS3758661.1 hypothetical protein [Bradyrhizobium centrosematis]MCS3773451.1 hypothetical protein [Bradyrhizobium centrosematis]